MQLERNYFRHLKKLKHKIYELCISARLAYRSKQPAVKTSRPQISMNICLQANNMPQIYAFCMRDHYKQSTVILGLRSGNLCKEISHQLSCAKRSNHLSRSC